MNRSANELLWDLQWRQRQQALSFIPMAARSAQGRDQRRVNNSAILRQ